MRYLTYCSCFVSAIISISACSHKKKAATATDPASVKVSPVISHADTAAYTHESLRAEDTSRKDDQGNYDYLQFDYPIFKTLPDLNKEIEKVLMNSLGDEKPPGRSFKAYFAQYQKSFAEPDSSDTENYRASTLDLGITVSLQGTGFVALTSAEGTSGGIHPNSNTSFINWNTKKDKRITLDDLFINYYQERLNDVAEKIFRKDAGLGRHEALGNYQFENDTFALNNNFAITDKGLYFLYNSYEIQAYVYGPTELLIPYRSIKHLLRPNTVVSQYIK